MSSLQCAFLIITSNLAVYITLHLLLQQVKPIPRLQGKREMLQMLTLMDSEASDKYLFEMLENKG